MCRASRCKLVLAAVAVVLLAGGVALAQEVSVDLSLSKSWEDFSSSPISSVIAGEEAIVHLAVSNSGEVSDAYNVVVEDFLPAGVTPVTVLLLDQGRIMMGVPGNPDRPLTWNVGYVAANDDPINLYLLVKVDPSVTEDTVLWNDAVVYPDDYFAYDFNNVNNVASAAVTVDAEADLEVTMYSGSDTGGISAPAIGEIIFDGDLVSGTVVTYVVTVTNAGPSVARAVKLWDWVDDGLQIQGARIVGGDGTVAVLNVEATGSDLSCDLGDIAPSSLIPPPPPIGSLAPAAAAATDSGVRTVLVDVLVLPDAYFTVSEVEHTAAVTSGEWDAPAFTYDPDTENNSTYLYADVIGEVDASITKTADVSTVLPGGQVVYTLTVANAGPSDGYEVTTEDYLPYGMIVTGVTTNRTEFLNVGDSSVWWGQLVLRKGESATLQIQASVASDPALVGTTLYNEADVYLGEGEGEPEQLKNKGFGPELQPPVGYFFDPNLFNNEAVAAVLVGSPNLPDLVADWWDCGFNRKGTVVSGYLEVTNQGTAVARNFRVHIGLTYDGESLSPISKVVTIKNLAPGASVDVPFKYTIGKEGMEGRQLMGIVDARQSVAESFENNNTALWSDYK